MFAIAIAFVNSVIGKFAGFNNQCVSAFWAFNKAVGSSETYSAVGAINLWWYSPGVPYIWETYDRITSGFQYADQVIWSDTFGAYQNYDPQAGRGYGHVAFYSRPSRPGYAFFYSQNPNVFQEMELSLSGVVGALRLKKFRPKPTAPKLTNVKTSGACSVRTMASSIAPEAKGYPDGLNKGVTVSALGLVKGQRPYVGRTDLWVKTKSNLFIWAGNIANEGKGLPMVA